MANGFIWPCRDSLPINICSILNVVSISSHTIIRNLLTLTFQINTELAYRCVYIVANNWYPLKFITTMKKQRTKYILIFLTDPKSAKFVRYFIFFKKELEISLAFIHPNFYSIIFPKIEVHYLYQKFSKFYLKPSSTRKHGHLWFYTGNVEFFLKCKPLI